MAENAPASAADDTELSQAFDQGEPAAAADPETPETPDPQAAQPENAGEAEPEKTDEPTTPTDAAPEKPADPATAPAAEATKTSEPQSQPAAEPSKTEDPLQAVYAKERELAERWNKVSGQIDALRAKKKTDAWDIEDGANLADLVAQRQDMTGEYHAISQDRATAQEQADRQFWTSFAKSNPSVKVDDAQQAWREEYQVAARTFPSNPPAAMGYARARWESRVESMKAPKPAAAVTTPPPAAPAAPRRVSAKAVAGSVAPPAAAPHRPPAPVSDPGAQFDKSITKEDLASFVV